MTRLILVFGTPGAGKTTVLSRVRSTRVVNMGDEMLRVYSKKFGISNRDEIRRISLSNFDTMEKTRNEALKKISNMTGKIVIDTHTTVKIGESYCPGLSLDDFKLLKGKVGAIIYLDAKITDIIKRREKDKSRKREKDSEEDVAKHREINLIFTTLCSLHLGAPMYVVNNEEGKVEEAQKRVASIIDSMN